MLTILFYQVAKNLLDIRKLARRLSRHGSLCLQTLALLPRAKHIARLAALVNSDDLDLLGARRLGQDAAHLGEHIELVERQLALEDGVGLLLGHDETLLERLHERHRLLHLAELADLGVQALVVDRQVDLVKGLAHQVDVLLLPGGVLLGGVDRQALGLARVECRGLALAELLGEVRFERGDVGGCGAHVAVRCRQLRRRLRDVGEAGEVDRFGLLLLAACFPCVI